MFCFFDGTFYIELIEILIKWKKNRKNLLTDKHYKDVLCRQTIGLLGAIGTIGS